MTEFITLGAGLAAAGLLSGFLAGLFGIGGGAILVPILITAFPLLGIEAAVTAHLAVGTSLAIILPIALVGASLYAWRGDIDWILVAAIASGSVIGVAAGSRLMMKVPARRLRQGFGVYALLLVPLMIWRGLG